MLSMIEVQCPHCGARGQIMVPPVGAIIIGPCPQCSELVVVFCGQVLPLDKVIMESDSLDDRQEHLLNVLTEFLRDRIGKLLTGAETIGEESDMNDEFDLPDGQTDDESEPVGETNADDMGTISQNEFDRFIEVDLKLLDNKAYFKSVFENK